MSSHHVPALRAGWLATATLVLSVFAVTVLSWSCTAPPPAPPAPPPAATPTATVHEALTAPALDRLHVLMINGGASPAENYQSHLVHLRRFVELLTAIGVPPAQISIFTADGTDLDADLAVRDPEPETDFWRLSGTAWERVLGTPVEHVSSTVPGFAPAPATRQEIAQWFAASGQRLQAGDTLLLYVTDHGNRNPENLDDNSISLWGSAEELRVSELQQLLAMLPGGVRVVTVMSQCYAGAFARLASTLAPDGVPTGQFCGYFSSPADRPAYGCYAETRGRDNVGHSIHFIEALAATGSFPAAHRQTLVEDATPDVPLRTSDVFLHDLLGRAAVAHPGGFRELVDELLREAWRDKGAWEPELRLLDRIAAAFGCFSPRSLGELEEEAAALPDISAQFKNVAHSWQYCLNDANSGNIDRFWKARPDWLERAGIQHVRALEVPAVRALTAELLPDLGAFTAGDPAVDTRVRQLNEKRLAAQAASYRMEVRLGVMLRLRALLTSIAGRVYVASRATAAEHAAHEALQACEAMGIPTPPWSPEPLENGDPFPPFDDDVRVAQAALPAWMGIQFRDVSTETVRTGVEQTGAARVMLVYPETPAAAAGLQVGDLVVGPPGAPFRERNEVRAFTMLSEIGVPRELEVRRDDELLRVRVVPEAFPLKWPSVPGPPKLSSPAPALQSVAYRGALPERLADGTPHLLLFWATWCGPCKASLPEVLAFERERGTPVIAITDEPATRLDAFFKEFDKPFPGTVAVDDLRRDFVAYGVSGTPTFVLVDGKGIIQSTSTGYNRQMSLGVTGWKWAEAAASGPSAETTEKNRGAGSNH